MMKFRKWISIRLGLVVLGFLLLTTVDPAGDRSEIATEKTHGIGESSLTKVNLNLAANVVDPNFRYGTRKGYRGSAGDRTVLISQRGVYQTVEELRKQIALPSEFRVVFEECGDPKSHYDKTSREIVVCYELIETFSNLFSRTIRASTARDQAVKGAVVSMFLHEVGHALIDRWNLAITGREEDAADQFSTLMLINGLHDGDAMALDGARAFKSLAILEKDFEKDYAGRHSLDEQRFYSAICLIYGHRPERYEYLIRDGSLPMERAYECEEDYARLNRSWQRLLAPYYVILPSP